MWLHPSKKNGSKPVCISNNNFEEVLHSDSQRRTALLALTVQVWETFHEITE